MGLEPLTPQSAGASGRSASLQWEDGFPAAPGDIGRSSGCVGFGWTGCCFRLRRLWPATLGRQHSSRAATDKPLTRTKWPSILEKVGKRDPNIQTYVSPVAQTHGRLLGGGSHRKRSSAATISGSGTLTRGGSEGGGGRETSASSAWRSSVGRCGASAVPRVKRHGETSRRLSTPFSSFHEGKTDIQII